MNTYYNTKRKLESERFYLTWADEQMPWTVRLTVRMNDVVDAVLLQQALTDVETRYPYYCIRLVTRTDERGFENYMFEENPQPWVLTQQRKPIRLIGAESNYHLLAFACWDDCIAIDFFHALTDGTGAYNVLRTLLFEYCRRRYDAHLDGKGVRMVGDTIGEEEWTDPVAHPLREPRPTDEPPLPTAINLTTDALCPIREQQETVNILLPEQRLMDYVRQNDTTPATLVMLLVARAVARLHKGNSEATPVVVAAVNLRPALHAPLACQSLAKGLRVALTKEIAQEEVQQQAAYFRQTIARLKHEDNVLANVLQQKRLLDSLEQMPLVATRHQVFSSRFTPGAQAANTAFVSYVGKANFGSAESYIRELYTQAFSPYALGVEMSAIGGMFCINFIQRFCTDIYLNAFLDELRMLGLDCEVVSRHTAELASIADFRAPRFKA